MGLLDCINVEDFYALHVSVAATASAATLTVPGGSGTLFPAVAASSPAIFILFRDSTSAIISAQIVTHVAGSTAITISVTPAAGAGTLYSDDTVGINNAILNTAYGAMVYMPTGVYNLSLRSSALIKATRNVRLVGDGVSTVLRPLTPKTGSTTAPVVWFQPASTDHWEFGGVESLFIQPESTAAAGVGIYLDVQASGASQASLSKYSIANVYVDNTGDTSLKVESTSTKTEGFALSTIRDSQFNNGIRLIYTGDSNRIERCKVSVVGTGAAIQASMVNVSGALSSELVIEDNNISAQGPAIVITQGRLINIFRNNIEILAGSNVNPVFIISLAGASTTILVDRATVSENYVGFNSSSSTNVFGNVVNIDYARDTVVEHNSFEIGTMDVANATNSIGITTNARNSIIGYNREVRGNQPGKKVADLGSPPTLPSSTRGVLRIPALSSPWANVLSGGTVFQPFGYIKTENNIVFLKGLVYATSSVSAYSTIATLELAFWPAQLRSFIVSSSTSAFNVAGALTSAEIRIQPTGEVQFMSGSSGFPTGFLSLDGICFYADKSTSEP